MIKNKVKIAVQDIVTLLLDNKAIRINYDDWIHFEIINDEIVAFVGYSLQSLRNTYLSKEEASFVDNDGYGYWFECYGNEIFYYLDSYYNNPSITIDIVEKSSYNTDNNISIITKFTMLDTMKAICNQCNVTFINSKTNSDNRPNILAKLENNSIKYYIDNGNMSPLDEIIYFDLWDCCNNVIITEG